MLQHLIFAFSYLRIAVIFKLAFSVMPELAQMEIRRRMVLVGLAFALSVILTILPWLIMPFFEV